MNISTRTAVLMAITIGAGLPAVAEIGAGPARVENGVTMSDRNPGSLSQADWKGPAAPRRTGAGLDSTR